MVVLRLTFVCTRMSSLSYVINIASTSGVIIIESIVNYLNVAGFLILRHHYTQKEYVFRQEEYHTVIGKRLLLGLPTYLCFNARWHKFCVFRREKMTSKTRYMRK